MSGKWSFGYAPKGCDLKFISRAHVQEYDFLVYQDNGNREIQRYTHKMVSFLRHSANFFI
jgi:hypothetical protein